MSPRCGWVVDDTGFPKKGNCTVGVARQYSGTLGKADNCHIGAGLYYATDEARVPLDFSLYPPRQWADDPGRCRRAGVPVDVQFRTKWQLALLMMEQVLSWGRGLRDLGLRYVVGVQSSTDIWLEAVAGDTPAHQGRGRPRTRLRDLPESMSAQTVAQRPPPQAWKDITWRRGTKGPLASRFVAIRAQASAGHAHGEVREIMGWLLIEWPTDADLPTKYWLSNLPEDTMRREPVYQAKLWWWAEQNYEQLKEEPGLDHFEGRSRTG